MNYEHWIVYQMKEEKRIFPFMYISLRKFMIMIAKNYIEFQFRLFWDTLYIIGYFVGYYLWNDGVTSDNTDKTQTLRKSTHASLWKWGWGRKIGLATNLEELGGPDLGITFGWKHEFFSTSFPLVPFNLFFFFSLNSLWRLIFYYYGTGPSGIAQNARLASPPL